MCHNPTGVETLNTQNNIWHIITISVNGEPVGKMVLEGHGSPIDFDFRDSEEKKRLKTLVGAMLNPDPVKRPDITEVLQELNRITGMWLNLRIKLVAYCDLNISITDKLIQPMNVYPSLSIHAHF